MLSMVARSYSKWRELMGCAGEESEMEGSNIRWREAIAAGLEVRSQVQGIRRDSVLE